MIEELSIKERNIAEESLDDQKKEKGMYARI